jgi:hypothetical protein
MTMSNNNNNTPEEQIYYQNGSDNIMCSQRTVGLGIARRLTAERPSKEVPHRLNTRPRSSRFCSLVGTIAAATLAGGETIENM